MARRGRELVLTRVEDPRCKRTRRILSGQNRGGVDDARRIPGCGCHTVGDGLGREGRVLSGYEMQRGDAFRRRTWVVPRARGILRSEQRRFALPAFREWPAGG